MPERAGVDYHPAIKEGTDEVVGCAKTPQEALK